MPARLARFRARRKPLCTPPNSGYRLRETRLGGGRMRKGRRVSAVVLLMLLAACSSIPLGTGSALRSLDYVNDDVASLLLAFDLPPSLEPAPEGSTLTFAVRSPASGDRQVAATLVM